MLQLISKLGKALNQKEQKTVQGGVMKHCNTAADCPPYMDCVSHGCVLPC